MVCAAGLPGRLVRAAAGSAVWPGYGLPWNIQPGGEEDVALG